MAEARNYPRSESMTPAHWTHSIPKLVRLLAALALFFTLLLAAFRVVAVAVFGRPDDSLEVLGPIFWLGFRFDARVISGILLVGLFLGSVRVFEPFRSARTSRYWNVCLGVVIVGLCAIYVGDFLHFRYLNQRLNASVLGFIADAQVSALMVWQSYPVVRGALAFLLLVTALVWSLGRIHSWVGTGRELPRPGVSLAWRTGMGVLLILGLYGRIDQYPLRWSDAFELRNDLHANLALSPVQSFVSSLSFRSTSYDLAKVKQHAELVGNYLGVKPGEGTTPRFTRNVPAGGQSDKRPNNVVLVICESFSAYKSSMWGNRLDTTPFFAELCRDGVFFDNCYTPHFGTARGVWATVTGIPDVELVKTASRNPMMVDQHTIINDFVGREKFYFIGGSSSWANLRGLLSNNIHGLRLYEEGSYDSPRIDVWGISDKNLFLEANKVLASQPRPFFAVIQTADNHRPYTIPEEDRREFVRVEVSNALLAENGFESNDELNAFRYTDFALRKFMEAARSSPYYADTLFVFVGDHGIGGDAGTMFPAAWTEKSLTSFHVPLLFYAPGFLKPQRIHSVASMVDLLPTVAGIVNLPYRNSGLGRDLLLQEQLDGGRSNVAFIIDHNNKSLGVVNDSRYTIRRLGESGYESAWADFAVSQGLDSGRITPAAHPGLIEGFFETSRYLLLTNKKPPVP